MRVRLKPGKPGLWGFYRITIETGVSQKKTIHGVYKKKDKIDVAAVCAFDKTLLVGLGGPVRFDPGSFPCL